LWLRSWIGLVVEALCLSYRYIILGVCPGCGAEVVGYPWVFEAFLFS